MGKKWGEILRRELLPQFLTDSHGIWHRCLPWGVDVQDIFFDSGRKCVAAQEVAPDTKHGTETAVRSDTDVGEGGGGGYGKDQGAQIFFFQVETLLNNAFNVNRVKCENKMRSYSYICVLYILI